MIFKESAISTALAFNENSSQDLSNLLQTFYMSAQDLIQDV